MIRIKIKDEDSVHPRLYHYLDNFLSEEENLSVMEYLFGTNTLSQLNFAQFEVLFKLAIEYDLKNNLY